MLRVRMLRPNSARRPLIRYAHGPTAKTGRGDRLIHTQAKVIDRGRSVYRSPCGRSGAAVRPGGQVATADGIAATRADVRGNGDRR